jgi:3-oxosteroid 1-dehydrogenase
MPGFIDNAPYYAVAINLGDLGTKGGLKADAQARVVDGAGRPIANLYAAGNCAGVLSAIVIPARAGRSGRR